MRIIEPHQLRREVKRKKAKRKKWALAIVPMLAMSGLFWLAQTYQRSDRFQPKASEQQPTASNAAETKPATDLKDRPLRVFNPDEFRDLYRSLAYPNIQEITTPPSITGNAAADQRIIALAEARGYRRQSVPVAPIVKINEAGLQGDDLLQPKAFEGWKELKELAKKDNMPIRLLSAYRSPEFQRELFMGRLLGTGVTAEQIAAGEGDAAVVQVLTQAAIPGYSRHHTGYTIDLACDDGTGVFANSSCFTWISANNYKRAKLTGWVPSYPEGAKDQGPEPEAWEYVWVGLETVVE